MPNPREASASPSRSISDRPAGSRESSAFADIAAIIQATARAARLPYDMIVGPRRWADYVRARHLAMWLAHRHTAASFPRIAAAFARDHTSVIHGVRATEMRLARDPCLRALASRLDAEFDAIFTRRSAAASAASAPSGVSGRSAQPNDLSETPDGGGCSSWEHPT